ncbi:NACHT domain-containing protein [Parafrankia sp. FMc2]|uniref:NACHT domain-containing protein n=1 Tax=Parafrankia sp. FMc2 TaxID=3233196 RepID=UPI0034D68849
MSGNGGRSQTQRSIWLTAGGAAVAAGWAAWLAGQDGWAAVLVAVGVLLPVAALLVDTVAARSGDRGIEKVADQLAGLVRDQWGIEATRRGVGRPPLEVFWRAADADLVQSWAELQQEPAGGRSGPVSGTPGSGPGGLAGSGALLAAYDRSPCGRLVVLGEPGAGKTVLLVQFVLDLIGRRQASEPVPLLVPLASWNPDWQSLYDWLEAQVLREYPHLSAIDAATGDTRAGALLRAGLILPVLDGLDEILAGDMDQALASINDELRSDSGLVLSCRTDEFRAAVHPHPNQRPIHLDGAAGIHLTPLTSTAVRGYLLAGAGNDGPTRWAQALTALADPTSSVAQALTTPLTAFLASTIYNPRPRESSLVLPNPTDLCALPTAAGVEQHLLAGFIPAAYRPHPDQPTRWTIKQASRYLAFLGHHLEHRMYTTSLAWWEIPHATPSTYRILTVGLTGGLATGLAGGRAIALASAWGRLGLARLWLAARSQQPLHLIAFLEDARERGVLRQAGAVWEFRHASLQRYFAGPP